MTASSSHAIFLTKQLRRLQPAPILKRFPFHYVVTLNRVSNLLGASGPNLATTNRAHELFELLISLSRIPAWLLAEQ
jgi:hypothetical protein